MPLPPLISVITPSYNQAAFVEKTIQSVLNQTYPHIEYIFVDGGSTDGTMSIVNRYRGKISAIINEKDRGQADAINKGFKLAKGELVGWLNSDDIYYPDCIETIVELYQASNKGAIYYHSYNDMIDAQGNVLKTYQHIIPDKLHLLKHNYNVIQMGSFYNANTVKLVNFLDISNYYCMDLDLWLGLLDHGPIFYSSDRSHAAFRQYPGTKTDTGKEKFLRNIHKVLKKHGAKPYYPTIWHKIYIYYVKCLLKRAIAS